MDSHFIAAVHTRMKTESLNWVDFYYEKSDLDDGQCIVRWGLNDENRRVDWVG